MIKGRWIGALSVSALLLGSQAGAADLQILAAGAVRAPVASLLPAFEAETGNKVHMTTGPVGDLAVKLESGTDADAVLLTPPVIDALVKLNLVIEGSRADLGSVSTVVAVKSGAPAPDVSSPDALKSALLAAKSIAYVDPKLGATSGIHFLKLLQQFGIADAVAAKTHLAEVGIGVSRMVADGTAEIGVTQKSEVIPVAGVNIVGPLPAPLQLTSIYSAGLVKNAKSPEAAQALVKYLTGPAGREKFKAAGFDPPP
ncbi:MAG TPA: substrate-binding domain-containing protein [Candidatus Cybelea sp.]|nr:substrate-binding domain-containing protein [Candidatus Cybelea sp.]